MSIIKSLSVGNGDMFYIRHNSDNFSIIDCCINEGNKEEILEELKSQSRDKTIRRFISTHPDDDHIRGLQYLNWQMPILNFYCVKNKAVKEYETADFSEYRSLRDSSKTFYLEKGCSRCWMNLSNHERGCSGIEILWPLTTNEHYKYALWQAAVGGSPNNISPIIQYSLESGVRVLWMGDLETEFMKNIEEFLSLNEVDILFAPHHGRDSGKIPKSWMNRLNPKIVVIGEAPSEHLNYYRGYNTIKQNSAGTLLFDCVQNAVHVYAESYRYKEDFLEYDPSRKALEAFYLLFYIGTLFL